MKAGTETIDQETVSRAGRNLELLRRFTQSIIDDPTMLDQVPDGESIIFLPEDDPELAEENLEGGMRMVRDGQNVYFRHMPPSQPDDGVS